MNHCKAKGGENMLGKIFNFFFNPETEVAGEIKNANILRGIKNYNIMPLIFAILIGIVVSAFAVTIGPAILSNPLLNSNPAVPMLLSIGTLAIVILPILSLILVTVITLIGGLLIWASTKILGGKATFTQIYYVSSVLAIAYVIIAGIPFIIGTIMQNMPLLALIFPSMTTVLQIVSIASLIFLIPAYAIMTYFGYASWLILKRLTGLSNKKLIISTIITIILAIILIIIIGALIVLMASAATAGR
ncbi:MAG: YIP1 family protein [Candidatus Diapherotrites archaeon]|nr:YIP1 family protein [Candidatus Diapherotrites archaeon]